MNKNINKVVAFSVCASILVYPVLTAPVAYADAQFREITPPATTTTQKTEQPKTFRERLEADKANAQVSNMPKNEAYVPGGTVLNLELAEALSSKTNRLGDVVKLKMLDNLLINDVVVVPAGALVYGKITELTGSGLFGRAGKLAFSVDSVKAVNGVEIPLKYMGKIEAGSDGGAVAVATVVSLVGGLFMKGKNVSVPAGTKIGAKVKNDTDLHTTLTNLPEAMNPSKPHGVAITIK